MDATQTKTTSWLDRPLVSTITLNWEIVLFTTLLILAILSRFYSLEARVMSHDENSHVYYSWLLYKGSGYSHDPVTHGPFQFHMVALSYFLFGDSDTSARIPAVLFSIATVAFMWNYRRYLGKAGAMVAAVLMIISPYMLYYGRYVRNEAFVALFGVVTLWAILRYLESGKHRYLYYLTLATVLHFTTKETAFIYTAQAMIFLAFYLIYRLTRLPWSRPADRRAFLIALMVGLLLVSAAAGVALVNRQTVIPSATETVSPAVPGAELENPASATQTNLLVFILLGLGAAGVLGSLFFLIRGYTWDGLRQERSFDMLVLLTTAVLPMLAPFPVKALGLNPIDYNNSQTILMNGVFIVLFALVAVAIGLLWKPRLWLINMALFYAVFVVFYTTVFTNGFGFVTGLVGSLGYWLEQQKVNRGSQPLYYYAFIQIPIYEFLPALGAILAGVLALFRRNPGEETLMQADPLAEFETPELNGDIPASNPLPVFELLLYWSVTSLLAYTIAGEKMPWLTVHIALPMILLAGWGLGKVINSFNWANLKERRGWLIVALLPVALFSLLAALGSLLGTNLPFQGKSLEQLRATTTFVISLVTFLISGLSISFLIRPWPAGQLASLLTLTVSASLGILTAQAAFRAAYINYDNATEYLVYAHSAGGVKEALAQIEELSERTSGGLNMAIAYDDATTYPYWWYLRNYTDQRYYGANPTRSLRDVPAILVGDPNYGKIEPVVGQAYYQFDYVRLWWPNQDYFGLTWERVLNTLRDPQMRSAVFKIWLNRDYKAYGEATQKDMSLPSWYPSARMRLYLRKDLVNQLWNYGTAPTAEEIVADPYEGKGIQLEADQIFGFEGVEPGQFTRPRGIAVAPDGSLYVADTGNHRIQHLDREGNVLQTWGSFGDTSTGQVPGGQFNEPWGIGVGPDGSVYVADTWNHRVQKFNREGEFVKMWGYFGQAEAPEAFWGPRAIAVDQEGRVFVTDTGNKRIVVFDRDGNFLTQFGTVGLNLGEFDEPVGIAADSEGRIYVADTWNQRIQVFIQDESGAFQAERSWDVVAWYGQSLDNKPYLAVNSAGQVFVTDPEGYRVLEFTSQGDIVRTWGDFGTGSNTFGLVGGIASDPNGGVWVTDPGNNRIMHFTPPEP
jgi:uncharacterized protein (TIGR03663 family)